MLFVGLRQALATFFRQVTAGIARDLPGQSLGLQYSSHFSAFQRAPDDPQNKVETCHAWQPRSDTPDAAAMDGKRKLDADKILKTILGERPATNVSNVLVVGNESQPLKRVEIHLESAEQVATIVKLLISALENDGFNLQVRSTVSIPSSDIWLISPLNDERQISLCCAAVQTEQMNSEASLAAARSRIRLNEWRRQSGVGNAIQGSEHRVQSRSQKAHSIFVQGGQERSNS